MPATNLIVVAQGGYRLNQRLPRYFLALFVPSAALVLGGAAFAYRYQAANELRSVSTRESIYAERGVHALLTNLEAYSNDLGYLLELPETAATANEPSDANLAALAKEVSETVRARRNIDQLRFIDSAGMERVRINAAATGIVTVPAAELQDKSDRYYVQEIAKLPAGAVYVSPLDLNIEHGVVENPHKPMVRVGAPVFDATGTRRGMLVINYLAAPMLEDFKQGITGAFGESMLLNADGFWLQSDDSRDEWGFMFGETDTFGLRHPEAWREIIARPSGQFRTTEGLWTFLTVQPRTAVQFGFMSALGQGGRDKLQAAVSETTVWKAVSFVSAAEIAALTRPSWWLLAGVASCLLLISLATSWLLARAWVRREELNLGRITRHAEENAASLRLVLQSNPNAMLIVDRDGKIVEANPSGESVFGFEPGALRGVSVDQLVPGKIRSVRQGDGESFEQAPRARPMGASLDLCARRADGQEFPVEVSLAPLALHGEPFVVATVVDISSRKRAEAEVRDLNANLERRVEQRTGELMQAESNLRLILDSSADGLYGVDMNGRITFVNSAACRILGCSPADLIGRPAEDLIVPDVNDAASNSTERPLARTLAESRSITVDDEYYRHASGRTLPVLYSTHPMIRDGALVGAVVSFMDITARRALDDAREAALQQAERLARARSDFLANMSHEIRTPLNGVLGLAQVGHREAYNPEQNQEIFGRILDAGRTLLGVVDNVLDFSRIEVGKAHIEAVPVRLRELIDEVMTPITPLADAKGLALQVRYAEDLPARCSTDPVRVKQVLMNLLANAVKFTEHGHVELAIARRDQWLHLRVSDTGIGISDEQAGRIFTAFEQADTSTTRKFGGTGLGLSISKRIVELMGGQISLTSSVGVGSTFEVVLPLVVPPPEASEMNTMGSETNGMGRTPRLAGVRILFAEDNEVNQMVMQAMLRPEGPELTTVGDGRLAVEQVATRGADAFDIVLMDLQMPVMDGYEATRRILEIAPDLPVIGQTAHVLQEAIEQCHAAGMVGHISKPIDRQDLVATIVRYARPRRAR